MSDREQVRQRLVLNAPLAVAASLQIGRIALDLDEAELRHRTREIGMRIRETDDAREGPRAFAQGRPPVWTGR